MTPRRILIGKIIGAHGLRGEVKLASYCQQPDDLLRYQLTDASGDRPFKLKLSGGHGGTLIARLEGVSDRNQAELLKGTALYITRDQLPEPAEGEYYWEDLTGLEVRNVSGVRIGLVKSVQNYGAGVMIETEMEGGKTLLLPFTQQFFPEIKPAAGYLVIEPPEVVEAKHE